MREALSYVLDNPERCQLADQDALNAVLDGRWQTLDWRWNATNYMSGLMPKQPFIRHFAGCKPWSPKKVGIERRFVDQWRSDLADSPWPGRFHEEAFNYRARSVFRPAMSAANRLAKSLFYANSSGKRGNRARLVTGLVNTLSAIERSAAAGAPADALVFARN